MIGLRQCHRCGRFTFSAVRVCRRCRRISRFQAARRLGDDPEFVRRSYAVVDEDDGPT